MIDCCPVCGGSDHESIVSLPSLPVLINAQVEPACAPGVPLGAIDLVACRRCGHLFNAAFDEELLDYDAAYENTLHFSPRFQEYATSLAERLVADHGLEGTRVGELGSGPGHFLSMLCDAGVADGLGWDPSFDAGRMGAPEHAAVSISTDPFPDDGSIPMTLAFSQHVLEHLLDPVAALAGQRAAVADLDGTVYAEVPNGALMVSEVALWDLIYEHLSFFVPSSLETAARRAGLQVDTIGTSYDDQFLWCEATPGPRDVHWLPDADEVTAGIECARDFGASVTERINDSRALVQRRSSDGPVALWGAGSKGMTFLNLLGGDAQVAAVVDINPRKLGAGVPGTQLTISGPEHLVDLAPSLVLAANPAYVGEIGAQLEGLGIDTEVMALWG